MAKRDLKSQNTPIAAKSAPGRFIAWCKQEQASLQQQFALMDQRKVLTGENRGSGWVDTTADSIERIRARLAELESLLTETGSATVLKPNSHAVGQDRRSRRWSPNLLHAERWARNISWPANAFQCVFGFRNREAR